jgi:ribosomal protein S18 acetylase RimI-like enzyme
MELRENWIAQLQVDPDRFRQGIGSALVRHAQTLQSELQLWCFQQNGAARAFYARHGFTAVEFTNGEGNAEKTPDARYIWRRS